jgi:glycosyltransferase involved in cell wall biosynthesis
MCKCSARGSILIKIVAILDNTIGSGGGFNQAVNAILQMQRLSINRFEFEVFTTEGNNVDFLNKIGIFSTKVKISIFDRFLAKFSHNSLWLSIQGRLKLIGQFEKNLIKHGCDVVYFVTPSNLCTMLQKLNYIATIWDLSHRESPEFPEVRTFNTFFLREKNYQHNLGSALFTLTDSISLADMASRYYGIERNRFIAMPFSPTPTIEQPYSNKAVDVLNKYSLEPHYFYYPAQFWAHKNHIRILQAMLVLRNTYDWTPSVIFSGKDYGNLDYIENFIKANNLEAQVKILGFVPSDDMRGLYENATAVVMPTYFGPTNLPPLEAWTIGIPLIYSVQLAEQAGNAAILVDPDSALELADAMLLCNKSEIRNQFISLGKLRLAHIFEQRKKAEDEFCEVLDRFELRRQCWL